MMVRWNRTDSLAKQRKALASAKAASAVQGTGLTQDMGIWLGQLGLLHGVPFELLVPDARMLPAESIRFFILDQNWQDALLDGVFSIGKASSRDHLHYETMRPVILSTTAKAMRNVRRLRRRQPTLDDPPIAPVITGFLLRSQLVSGWPGLCVDGFDQNGKGLRLLRLESLAPEVLIGLFDGWLAQMHITEPAESLHFGVTNDGSTRQIELRWLETSSNHQVGQDIDPPQKVNVVMRPDPNGNPPRVINIAQMISGTQGLQEMLQTAKTLNGALSPSQFALQMVRGNEQEAFDNPNPPPSALSTEDVFGRTIDGKSE